MLGKREISTFVGHELIYDYISHKLDDERRSAVEHFVSESREAEIDMTKMLNGLHYVERLGETVVSDSIIERINEPSTYLAVLLKKTNFQRWPTSVKWALEALVVISLVIMTTLFIPWDRVSKFNPFPEAQETILAEIDREQQEGGPQKLKELETQPAEFADDEKTDPAIAATTVVAGSPRTMPEKPTPPSATAQSSAPAASDKENKKPGEGALFRGQIALTNVEVVGPKIREKIIELGGRKAGEVELGWSKTPNSNYFHFTLPEAKYQELYDFLVTYGKMTINKEKHPRVMPDGIIRLIITVDEAGQ